MTADAVRTPTALLVAAVLAAAAAGCGGSSGRAVTAGAQGSASPATGTAHPTPGASRSWSRERMRRVRQFLATATVTVTPSARPARQVIRVGALFYNDSKGDHFCTASVVDSPRKNLLITAAHCIHGGQGGGYKTDLVFVPQYRNGDTPEGTWPIKALTVDDRWINSSDPDLDVGFVTVGSVGGRNIAEVLGANSLGIDQGFDNIVRIVGYPSNGDEPIACLNKTTKQSAYQLRFACNGYYGGTSGSPWLTRFDPKTRTGQIVGVIGGYQEGGNSDEVSYSPYFDEDVKSLYDKAVAQS